MRIIAGTFKGRSLSAPSGLRTRPTAARVREALFSMLGDVTDANVLDLYAGSGALGLEALSRGARSATFVEAAKDALACLRANVDALGAADRTSVLPLRAERAIGALSAHGPFDLVFCDPPWDEADRALGLLERMAEAELFAPAARVLLEHAARHRPEPLNDGPLVLSATRCWGDTAVSALTPARGRPPPERSVTSP